MRRAIFAANMAALSSCALFPSLSELTGDGGVDAAFDGASSEAAADGASDIETLDASDASADAIVDAPFSCAQTDATFCDDFDDTNANVFPKWSSMSVDPLGAIARTSLYVASAPNALLTTVASNDGGVAQSAYLAKSFSTIFNTVHYAYKLRVETFGTHNAVVGQVNVHDAAGDFTEFRLRIGTATQELDVGAYPKEGGASTYTLVPLTTPIVAGVWYAVVMDIDLTKVPATLTLTIDGKNQVGPQAPIPVATFGPGTITLQAGYYYTEGPSTPWATRFDDVLAILQ